MVASARADYNDRAVRIFGDADLCKNPVAVHAGNAVPDVLIEAARAGRGTCSLGRGTGGGRCSLAPAVSIYTKTENTYQNESEKFFHYMISFKNACGELKSIFAKSISRLQASVFSPDITNAKTNGLFKSVPSGAVAA